MSRIHRMRDDESPGVTAFQRPTTTSSERVEIPATMIGRFCTFSAETADAYVRLGDGAVDVAAAADSTLAAEALTEAATTAMLHVPAGQSRRIRLRGAWTHFSHVGSAAGRLRFGASSGSFGSD